MDTDWRMGIAQPKRLGRPPKDGKETMAQTALRMPVDLLKFYRGFNDPSDHMRRALEEYRSSRNGHNDVA